MKSQALDLVYLNELSDDEALLASLHEVGMHTTDSAIREKAFSLVRWFMSRGELTFPQKKLAQNLVRGHSKSQFLRNISKPRVVPAKARPKPKLEYVLYAARIVDQLKVGYSANVELRIKSYRTGSSEVELLATLALGSCSEQHARIQERKLHAHLAQHRIERELFTLDALPAFRDFVPRAEA